jgi:hypothetical protein
MGGGSQEIEGMNAAGWPMDELVVGGQLILKWQSSQRRYLLQKILNNGFGPRPSATMGWRRSGSEGSRTYRRGTGIISARLRITMIDHGATRRIARAFQTAIPFRQNQFF